MNFFAGKAGLACVFVAASLGASSPGLCASGESLLQELRQQVEVQRHDMSAEDLRFAGDAIGRDPANPGDVVECTAKAVAAFRAGEPKSFNERWDAYFYNAEYARATLPVGQKYCVYLIRPVERGLTVAEARDLFVAEHMEFPRYVPSTADQQAGEEQFAGLRKQAIRVRESMASEKRSAVDRVVEHVVECSADELEANGTWREHGRQIQHDDIGASGFVWEWSHSADGDMCLVNRSPLHRALSVEEARDILTLSHLPLPSMQFASPVTANGAKRKSGVSAPSPKEEKKNPPSPNLSGSDTRSQVTTIDTPEETALALVEYTGSDSKVHYASAVQVSQYVFMTAAHVIVDEVTFAPNTGIKVRPHYRLPSETDPIPGVGVIDTSYKTGDSVHRYAHDIGFIDVSVSVPGTFIKPWKIDARADVGLNTGQYGCPLGNSLYDPLFIPNAASEPKSWFNGTIPSDPGTVFGCITTRFASTFTIGYPVKVSNNTVANTDHYAYIDRGGRFTGYGSQAPNQLYELKHFDVPNSSPIKSCTDCSPVEALKSWVTEGDSGGAVFGVVNGQWTFLGLIGSAVLNNNSIGGLAGGDFNYNDPWIQAQMKWTPTTGTPQSVTISSPDDGGVYDRTQVPNLVASAGDLTSQIQWNSDIDGFLGTGGNVPLAGRLRPAGHTITASLPAGIAAKGSNSTSAATIVSTIYITITGINPPQIFATPRDVIIPYGATSAQTTISWTVLCDCKNWRTDVAYTLNGGSYVWWKDDARAGSDVFSVHAGDVVNFYGYQHHYGPPNSMLVTVTGTAGAKPTLAAPAQVIVPYGQTTANFPLTWNAPGFAQVTLYGRQNLQNSGLIQCLGSGPGSGTNQQGINVGENLTLWLLPYTGCTGGSIVSALPATAWAQVDIAGVAGAHPTLSANPPTVSIPAGQNHGDFDLTWNAPGYSQVTLYGQQSLQSPGPIQCLGSGAGAGTVTQGITLGATINFWLLPYTACAAGSLVPTVPPGAVATAFVKTSSPPPPSMDASPNPVIIPAGQTTGVYTLVWSAQGNSQVTLYGQTTLPTAGPIRCLGSGPPSGTAQQGINLDETQYLWLLPFTNCTPGATVSAVPNGVLVTRIVRARH